VWQASRKKQDMLHIIYHLLFHSPITNGKKCKRFFCEATNWFLHFSFLTFICVHFFILLTIQQTFNKFDRTCFQLCLWWKRPGVYFSLIGSWAQFLKPNFFPPFWDQIVGRKSYEKRAVQWTVKLHFLVKDLGTLALIYL
jgi:hypothetical protein